MKTKNKIYNKRGTYKEVYRRWVLEKDRDSTSRFLVSNPGVNDP